MTSVKLSIPNPDGTECETVIHYDKKTDRVAAIDEGIKRLKDLQRGRTQHRDPHVISRYSPLITR